MACSRTGIPAAGMRPRFPREEFERLRFSSSANASEPWPEQRRSPAIFNEGGAHAALCPRTPSAARRRVRGHLEMKPPQNAPRCSNGRDFASEFSKKAAVSKLQNLTSSLDFSRSPNSFTISSSLFSFLGPPPAWTERWWRLS